MCRNKSSSNQNSLTIQDKTCLSPVDRLEPLFIQHTVRLYDEGVTEHIPYTHKDMKTPTHSLRFTACFDTRRPPAWANVRLNHPEERLLSVSWLSHLMETKERGRRKIFRVCRASLVDVWTASLEMCYFSLHKSLIYSLTADHTACKTR